MSRLAELGARLQSGETSVNIVGNRKRFFIASLALVIISMAGLGIRHLNLGVEFQGGAVFQFKDASISVADARDAVSGVGIKDPVAQRVGTDGVRVETGKLDPQQVIDVRAALSKKAGVPVEEITDQVVGASWGSDVSHKALKSLIIFLALLAIYLAVVFEWKLAVGALVALVHDVAITTGIYAIVGFQVSPATVIGLLTILGYSLYDTVVVYDKLRENTVDLTTNNRYTYSGAANLAINQTLVRSVNTSLIALLPVAGMLFIGAGLLGAGVLKDLALVLFVGMAVGAYSSIFIATPLVAVLKEREPEMQALAKRVAQRAAAARKAAAAAPGVAVPETDEAGDQFAPAAAALREGAAPGERVQPKRGGSRASRRPPEKKTP
jgi:preprotein translocase subunit SecF